jgi:hypothetical protein
MRKADHGLDDLAFLAFHQHLADEGTVDLDRVELEIAEMVEPGIAGAEIVKSDLDPDIAERLQGRLHLIEPSHHRALGDLDLEPLRGEASRHQDAEDLLRELNIGELAGR